MKPPRRRPAAARIPPLDHYYAPPQLFGASHRPRVDRERRTLTRQIARIPPPPRSLFIIIIIIIYLGFSQQVLKIHSITYGTHGVRLRATRGVFLRIYVF